MYTREDREKTDRQIRKRWMVIALISMTVLCGIVVSLVVRWQWLTILLTIVLGAVLLLGIDLFVKPLVKYRAHLRMAMGDALRTLEGDYISRSTEESMIDGLRCTSFLVTDTDVDGEPCERLFYYDSERAFPELAAGTPLRIRYYDRTVAELTVLHPSA